MEECKDSTIEERITKFLESLGVEMKNPAEKYFEYFSKKKSSLYDFRSNHESSESFNSEFADIKEFFSPKFTLSSKLYSKRKISYDEQSKTPIKIKFQKKSAERV